jgi:hypothetical protein
MNTAHKAWMGTSLFVLLTAPPTSLGANLDDIAWVPEDVSSECTAERYEFPASLVPLQDDMAVTGGMNWRSFDETFTLALEGKASYYGTPIMNRKTFLAYTKCDYHHNPAMADEETAKKKSIGRKSKRLACEEGLNKINDMSIEDKTEVCAHVIAIAPDVTDKSRFITELMLCGPLKERKLVWATTHRIFTSLSFTYRGCCKKTEWNGCKCSGPNCAQAGK